MSNKINGGGSPSTVKATFLETFAHDGSAWVTMEVEIQASNGTLYKAEVDFDNPEQVESCMWQMQQYLRNREIFRRNPDDRTSQAAEDPAPYGL